MTPTDIDATITELVNQINEAATIGIERTPNYRLMLAMVKEPCDYKDSEEIAATLSLGFASLPAELTDDQLNKIAKATVSLTNKTYHTLLGRFMDVTLANKLLKMLISNERRT